MTLPSVDDYNATYGGNKVNYSDVVDPTTDLDASASNAMRATAAGISATCFRAIIKFYITSPGNTPVISNFWAVWDTVATAAPTITYLAAGNYQITFPATVIDVRGNSQSLALLGGIANPDVTNGNGYFTTVQTNGLASNVVKIWNTSCIDGLLEDMGTGNTITVMLR